MSLLPESMTGSFQEACARELDSCATLEKLSPSSGRMQWLQAKSKLLASGEPRVVVADLDLTKANLKAFDFSRCYFTRVKFCDAELGEANFRQAIFRDADFGRAYLHQADLSLVDLRSCNLNFATPVSDIRGVRPWLAEKIEIAQYRSDHSVDTKNWFLRKWFAITGFGSSIRTLGWTSFVIILLFGIVFYTIQLLTNEKLFTDHMSMFGSIEYSALVFLNSGPGLLTSNVWVLLAVTTEVALGILILALFIASVTRRLVIFR